MSRLLYFDKVAMAVALFAFVSFASASVAKADTLAASCVGNTCTVSTTNSQGNIVNATASFVFGSGTVTVTLTNNLTNAQMKDVSQAITGLVFTATPGSTVGSLTTSSGASTNVAANGTATPAGAIPTGWVLNSNPLDLCVICSPSNPTAPEHAIIGGTGTGSYPIANGSIAGNDPHNPFLYGPVTFTLSITGVTSSSVVSAVSIRFNTDFTTGTPVPEPASMLLLGTGLIGVATGLRKRLKKNG